jgi:dihydroxyacetone kinase
MAGCSLTVMWLDDELERLQWCSPADTQAYRKGRIAFSNSAIRTTSETQAQELVVATADDDAVGCGTLIAEALAAIASRMVDVEDELGRIDAVAGDGDHGRGMVKGTAAANAAADALTRRRGGTESVLIADGEAWAAKAGGTSGVLWGAALSAAGRRLGDSSTPRDRDVADALRAGYDALVSLGGAQPGDKTMLDALAPFVESVELAVADGSHWRSACWRRPRSRGRQPPCVPELVGPAHWPNAASAPPTLVPSPLRCASTSSPT